MNYEQKYNEALEVMRQWIAPCHTKEQLDTLKKSVFPELAESEDERTRKWITNYIHHGVFNEEEHPMALKAIEWLEKQKEQIPYIDFVIKPHKGDDNNPYDMQVSEAQEYAIKRGFGVPFNDGEVYVDERHMTQTIGNILRWADEHPKEQKPVEDISQLTVQGKGVYKICPRCKERMVRDDSKVYTSMPPQYGYDCPKCGYNEFDTVMYDNPEMDEQKPASTEDMPYITDEHFYERAPEDSFKYKLAEYMTKCCTKKEGPYGYTYGISAETILKMAEEELLKRGVVQKPAEWSEEDERTIDRACVALRAYANGELPDILPSEILEYADKLQSLRPQKLDASKLENFDPVDVLKRIKKEWPMAWSIFLLSNNDLNDGCPGVTGDPDPAGVWKPSEEQMKTMLNAEGLLRKYRHIAIASKLAELYEDLKKL